MGFSSEGGVAPFGRLWYKSAALISQNDSPSHILSETGTPRMSPPNRGLVCGHRPKTEREVNCVI